MNADDSDIIELAAAGDAAALMSVLKNDRQALIRQVERVRADQAEQLREELVSLVTSLAAQRDALLAVAQSAQAMLTDAPGLRETYAGDLLARRLERIGKVGLTL